MLQPPTLTRQECQESLRQESKNPSTFTNPRTGRLTTFGSRTHRELVRDGLMSNDTLKKKSQVPIARPTPRPPTSPRKKPKLEKPPPPIDLTSEDESDMEDGEIEVSKEDRLRIEKYFNDQESSQQEPQETTKPGDRLRAVASPSSSEEEED